MEKAHLTGASEQARSQYHIYLTVVVFLTTSIQICNTKAVALHNKAAVGALNVKSIDGCSLIKRHFVEAYR